MVTQQQIGSLSDEMAARADNEDFQTRAWWMQHSGLPAWAVYRAAEKATRYTGRKQIIAHTPATKRYGTVRLMDRLVKNGRKPFYHEKRISIGSPYLRAAGLLDCKHLSIEVSEGKIVLSGRRVGL